MYEVNYWSVSTVAPEEDVEISFLCRVFPISRLGHASWTSTRRPLGFVEFLCGNILFWVNLIINILFRQLFWIIYLQLRIKKKYVGLSWQSYIKLFIYFLSLVIKKFDATCIIILLMQRVWETKHLFFWPKLVEPITRIHCMYTVMYMYLQLLPVLIFHL